MTTDAALGTPQPIVRQALYLEAAERLREMIRSRVLAAGEWVDELRVAAQLGISRTPLREALKLLASEGLVRLEPRRGCFVNELSMRDLDDIFPLMAMLEGRCAYEAARKAGPEDVRRLAALHDILRDHATAGRIDAYYEANYVIHEAIQALADNRWLSDTIGNLRKVLSLSRHKSLTLPGRIGESCAEHMAIFAAIRDRDPERAEAVARKHLLHQLDALHVLEQGGGAIAVAKGARKPAAAKPAQPRSAKPAQPRSAQRPRPAAAMPPQPAAARSTQSPSAKAASDEAAAAIVKEPVHDRSRTARTRARGALAG